MTVWNPHKTSRHDEARKHSIIHTRLTYVILLFDSTPVWYPHETIILYKVHKYIRIDALLVKAVGSLKNLKD